MNDKKAKIQFVIRKDQHDFDNLFGDLIIAIAKSYINEDFDRSEVIELLHSVNEKVKSLYKDFNDMADEYADICTKYKNLKSKINKD